MKASDILLDGFDYSSESILEWKLINSDSILNGNMTALLNTSVTPLTVHLPENPKANDEIRIVDAKGTFNINNVTITTLKKIMANDNDIILNKSGSYITFVYIDETYGWKYSLVNTTKIDGIPLDITTLEHNYILKYRSSDNSFYMEQLSPNSYAPIISGPTSGIEGTSIVLTIDNYSNLNVYTLYGNGTISRVDDQITWLLPEVVDVTDESLVVTVEEPGKLPNAATYIVSVQNIWGDDAIIYTNDCNIDFPESQSGTFVYTDGELQDVGDTDWYKAQVQMVISKSEQLKMYPESTITTLVLDYYESGIIASGDTILVGTGENLEIVTVGNVVETGSGPYVYTCTSMSPALTAMPDKIYLDDNTMYIASGNDTDELDPTVLKRVEQGMTYDIVGINAGSGMISNSDTLIIEGKENTVASVIEEAVRVDNKGFFTVTYTGNGTNQVISGLGFKPDFVWIKCRSVVRDHVIFDSVRGTTNVISSNSAGIQTSLLNSLVYFNDDGFTVEGDVKVNNLGDTYVAWCWSAPKKSCYDGQVEQYNDEFGFSIIKYTGNGTSKTLNHSLGKVPELVIIKSIDGAYRWIVGGQEIDSNYSKVVYLDGTEGAVTSTTCFSGAPTDTQIVLGTNVGVNEVNKNHIAYIWSELPGTSKFGSYTGNGNVTGPIVNVGFKPSYVMIKRKDAVSSWALYDNKRDTDNPPISNMLYPNLSNVEVTSTLDIEFTSTGFQIKNIGNPTNTLNGTYMYIAFSEQMDVVKYKIETTVDLEDAGVDDLRFAKHHQNTLKGAYGHTYFTIGTDHYLAVANYDSNSKIYKWSKGRFEESQTIIISKGIDCEYFSIGTDHYIVIATLTPTTCTSKIYKWNGSSFIEFQSITTGQLERGWTHFSIGTDHYLAIPIYWNGSSTNINSKIYKWNGTSFIDFQSIATYGAFSWEYFQIGTDHYLAVANYSHNTLGYNTDSKIYKWNGTSFIDFQSIATNAAQDWEYFTIGTDHYLAVANHYNGTTNNINSKIYKWNGTSFALFQNILNNRAKNWEYFAIGTDHYLVLALSDYTKVYKWNGTSFVEFQSILTGNVLSPNFFTIDDEDYLSITIYSKEVIEVYKWSNISAPPSVVKTDKHLPVVRDSITDYDRKEGYFDIEFQNIIANGASDWEYFTIGTDHYLAVANAYNGTSYNINSKIYKWNGSSFVEFQSIATNGARNWEYFTIGADHYLAVANAYNGSSYNIDSKIYKWNGSSFVEFQSIATIAATNWEYFTIGTDYYLVVAYGATYNIDSKIYKWNGNLFNEFQSIATLGAFDWEHFTIGTDHYLAVANYISGATYNINSKIYKWNGLSFVEFQSIATQGAYNWEYFQIGTDHYLAVANSYNGSSYNINSKIYKWNGTSFVEFQSIATNGAINWKYFQIGADHYLAVANNYNGTIFSINSKTYKWNGTTFIEFQSIPTNGGMDFEHFTIGADHYLALVNYYNGSSFNINSVIYKWWDGEINSFKQISEEVLLPSNVRQLAASVSLKKDEEVKDVVINTWKL